MPGNPTTGNDYLLYIDQNSVGAEDRSWLIIGGQLNLSIERGIGESEVTDKDSNHEEEYLPTNKSAGISFEFNVETDDSGFQELEKISKTREFRYFYYIRTDGKKEYCKAFLSEFSVDAPQDEVATGSGSLRITGGFTDIEP